MNNYITIPQAEAIERYIEYLPSTGHEHYGWFFEWLTEDDVITAFSKDAVKVRLGVRTNKQYMLNDLMKIFVKHGIFVSDRSKIKAEFIEMQKGHACIIEMPITRKEKMLDDLLPNNMKQAFDYGVDIIEKYSDIKLPVTKKDIGFINSLLEKLNMLLRATSYDRNSDVWKYSEVNYTAWMDGAKICLGIKSEYMFDYRYTPLIYLARMSMLHAVAKALGFDTSKCAHHAEFLKNKFPVLVIENELTSDGKD